MSAKEGMFKRNLRGLYSRDEGGGGSWKIANSQPY